MYSGTPVLAKFDASRLILALPMKNNDIRKFYVSIEMTWRLVSFAISLKIGRETILRSSVRTCRSRS
jgi:hypothetical protein